MNNNTVATTQTTTKNDIADTTGLIGVGIGYIFGLTGELARGVGADGIHGSYSAGRNAGIRHANYVVDQVTEFVEQDNDAPKPTKAPRKPRAKKPATK